MKHLFCPQIKNQYFFIPNNTGIVTNILKAILYSLLSTERLQNMLHFKSMLWIPQAIKIAWIDLQ